MQTTLNRASKGSRDMPDTPHGKELLQDKRICLYCECDLDVDNDHCFCDWICRAEYDEYAEYEESKKER